MLIHITVIKSSHIRSRGRSYLPSSNTNIELRSRPKFPNLATTLNIYTKTKLRNELKLHNPIRESKEVKILLLKAAIFKEDQWISYQTGRSQGRNREKTHKDVVESTLLEEAFPDPFREMAAIMALLKVLCASLWKTSPAEKCTLMKTRKCWLMGPNCWVIRELLVKSTKLVLDLERADIHHLAKLNNHTPTLSRFSNRGKTSLNRLEFRVILAEFQQKLLNWLLYDRKMKEYHKVGSTLL